MQPATWAVLVLLLVPCMELVCFAAITGERYVPKDLFFYIVGLGLFTASLALRYHVQEIIREVTPEHPLLVPGNRLHLSPEQREAAGEGPQVGAALLGIHSHEFARCKNSYGHCSHALKEGGERSPLRRGLCNEMPPESGTEGGGGGETAV
jgi:general stress protein CsbA